MFSRSGREVRFSRVSPNFDQAPCLRVSDMVKIYNSMAD